MDLDIADTISSSFLCNFIYTCEDRRFKFQTPINRLLPINAKLVLDLSELLSYVKKDESQSVADFFTGKVKSNKHVFTVSDLPDDPEEAKFASVLVLVNKDSLQKYSGIILNLSAFLPGSYLYKDLTKLINGLEEIRKITHDLNNHFQIISGFSSVLENELEDDEQLEFVQNISQAINKAIDNNKELRSFFPSKKKLKIFRPEMIKTAKNFVENEQAREAQITKKAEESRSKLVDNTDLIKVMVVDDEPMVQRFLCETLRRLKYSPHGFGSGKDALLALKDKKQSFRLAILDMNLADIETEELFEKIKEQNEQMKFILISGDNLNEASQRLLGKGASDYLQKPASIETLAKSISNVLKS
jgi:CheY-like chemotaxis protein